MTLSQVLAMVGDINVEFQHLDTDCAGAQRTKHGTKICFCTGAVGPDYLLGGHKKIGLVVWLPRNGWDAAIEVAKKERQLNA